MTRGLYTTSVFLAAALAGGCATNHAGESSPAVARHAQATPAEASLLLFRAGVTPDALAAVGATGEEVERICLAAVIACSAYSPTFSDLLETEATQHRLCQDLTDKARAGRAAPEDRAALAVAHAALLAARDAQEDAADLVRLAANSTLDEMQREWLWNIAAARSVETPVAFKVMARPDNEWRSLRDEIGAARANGSPVVPSDGDAAAAQALYEQCIADVAAAWDGALRPR